MKRTIAAFMMMAFLLATGGPALAGTYKHIRHLKTILPSTAIIAINANAFQYDAAGHPGTVWTPEDTTLGFGNLTYDLGLGIWKTSQGFAIDVTNSGTLPGLVVKLNYAEGANPNGAGHGLGYKVAATLQKLVYVDATTTTITDLGTRALRDTNGITVGSTTIPGVWFRVQLGIVTKTDDGIDNTEVFTSSDKAGTYTGTLTVTATVS